MLLHGRPRKETKYVTCTCSSKMYCSQCMYPCYTEHEAKMIHLVLSGFLRLFLIVSILASERALMISLAPCLESS